MVRREDIDQAVNASITKVLTFGQMALHPGQFEAFRKAVLDEFGRNGLGARLDRVFNCGHAKATDRIGPDHTGQGKGAGMIEPAYRNR